MRTSRAARFLAAALACATSGVGQATVRGMLTWGHELRSFEPCGGGVEYWAIAPGAAGGQLRTAAGAARARQGTPYPRLYAELAGEVDQEGERPALASDFDGLLRVSEVVQLADSPPCGCPTRSR